MRIKRSKVILGEPMKGSIICLHHQEEKKDENTQGLIHCCLLQLVIIPVLFDNYKFIANSIYTAYNIRL